MTPHYVVSGTDTGIGKTEHWNDEESDRFCQSVLQRMKWRSHIIRLRFGGLQQDHESRDNASDGRMNAGVEHEEP